MGTSQPAYPHKILESQKLDTLFLLSTC